MPDVNDAATPVTEVDTETKGKPLNKAEMEAKIAELEAKIRAFTVSQPKEPDAPAAKMPDPTIVDPNEMVPIYLIYDGVTYKDDLFVGINRKTFLIQRGKTVMVPRYVKEAIDENARQDMATALLIARRVAEAQELGKAMGVA